ncbi:MAG: hypothetical protein IKP21_06160, partial [Bacteroidales bacterium]|nr:hypothetical protein [Bacteroidales bacterium]
MNAVSESYRASVNHGDSPFSLFSRRFPSLSGGPLSFFPRARRSEGGSDDEPDAVAGGRGQVEV